MMELGATVCRRARRRAAARARSRAGAPSRGSVAARRARRARPRERFEDTDRWVRGRVVAALAAGEGLPAIPAARLEPALAGLERDGLVVRRRDEGYALG